MDSLLTPIRTSESPPDPIRSTPSSPRSSSEEEESQTLVTGTRLPATGRKRNDSLFDFDFGFQGLDLSASRIDEGLVEAGRGGRGGEGDSEKVGLIGGMALVVGMMIGSGIFSSPGVVAKETGSVGAALLVWVSAGLLSWAGASSFAELGSALPLKGGAQAYLSISYSPLISYCFSFTQILSLKPGSQAIISLIGSEYLCRLIYHTAFAVDPRAARLEVSSWAVKGVAVGMVAVVAGVQCASSRVGRGVQTGLTGFKILAILALFITGLVFLGIHRGATGSDFTFSGSTDEAAGWALALFSALWTYDGWDQANYIAKDCAPGTLPIMINSSLALVLLLFLCANISYFLVLPFTIATATSTIGLDYGRALAGPVGGVLFAVIVSLSCLGALNGSLYTSSRLIIAAAEQSFLPEIFSHYHTRQRTPINGIMLSSGLSLVFIAMGDFKRLTLFYGVCAWTWNFLVVVGLLILRVKEPTLKRPYRTFLATPILFASTALFLIVLSVFTKPWESVGAFAFCTAGAIPYYFQTRRSRAREEMEMHERERRGSRLAGLSDEHGTGAGEGLMKGMEEI